MNTPDEVYERVGDALGYASGAALSATERMIADVAYHYRTVQNQKSCVLCNPGTPDEIRQREQASAELDRLIVEDEHY